MKIEVCTYHDCNSEQTCDYCLPCKDCPRKEGCPDRCPNEDCTSCYWMTEVDDESRSVEM